MRMEKAKKLQWHNIVPFIVSSFLIFLQIKASQKDKTTEAKWVSEFFKMLEKEQVRNGSWFMH